jgi:hypothetical protein
MQDSAVPRLAFNNPAPTSFSVVPTVEIDKKLSFDRHDFDRAIEPNKRVA